MLILIHFVSLTLFDYADSNLRVSLFKSPNALLTCCFATENSSGQSTMSCGGLSGHVHYIDAASESAVNIGSHKGAVRCMEYSPSKNMVLSGSWDSTVCGWDPRTGAKNTGKPVCSSKQPNKVFSMDFLDSKGLLIVGHAGRTVSLYDIRKFEYPIEHREPALDYQTRDIKMFPGGHGYALGCTAGRVVVDYFNDISVEKTMKMFKFKCHRMGDKIFPVNAIAFHPIHGTFVTGGGDKMVCTVFLCMCLF